jgi:hypothetical protein
MKGKRQKAMRRAPTTDPITAPAMAPGESGLERGTSMDRASGLAAIAAAARCWSWYMNPELAGHSMRNERIRILSDWGNERYESRLGMLGQGRDPSHGEWVGCGGGRARDEAVPAPCRSGVLHPGEAPEDHGGVKFGARKRRERERVGGCE